MSLNPRPLKPRWKLTQPGRQLFVALRERAGQARWNTAAVCESKVRHSAAAISERESALSVSDPAAREARLLASGLGTYRLDPRPVTTSVLRAHVQGPDPSGEVLAAGEGRDSHIHDERQRQ